MKLPLFVVALMSSLAFAQDVAPEAPPQTDAPEAAAPAPEPTVVPPPPPSVSPTPNVPQPAKGKPVATATVLNRTPEAEQALSGWHLGVDLDNSVGSGTFDNPETSALLVTGLVIAPSYAFRVRGVKLSAGARGMLTWEHSLPDNANGRRLSLWDTRLSLSAPAVWTEPLSGLALTPRFGLLVPTSMESRFASMLTSLTVGLGFSRTLGRFDLGYQLSGGKGIHFNTQALQTKSSSRDPQGSITYLGRVDEAYASSNGNNVSWSLANSLDLIFRATDKLSFAAVFSVINYWRYAVTEEVDELTPKARDAAGNPVARVGLGRGDRMLGSLGVSYSLTDRFGVGAGVSTDSAPFTRDNQNLRFPFFDFVSANDNLTTFSLTFSAYL